MIANSRFSMLTEKCFHFAFVCILSICACLPSVSAQQDSELPELMVDKGVEALLGEVYSDSRISIRVPRNLRMIEHSDSPELTANGVYKYGWIAEGVTPRGENLSIGLTPYAMPSSASLDKVVEGMKDSVKKGLEDVSFKEVQKSRFRGIEVRSGEYSARVLGEKMSAFYLIGIDDVGTFGVTAMVPTSKLTAEKSGLLKATILTFERIK
jgi:hypothetical protein